MDFIRREEFDHIFSNYGHAGHDYTQVFHNPEGSGVDFQFGNVMDIKDPDKLGRVKVQLPVLGDEAVSDWIPVVRPYSGSKSGFWYLPDVGETVLCGFINGNPQLPVVLGTRYTADNKPPAESLLGTLFKNNKDPLNDMKVITTKAGTKIEYDDSPVIGKIAITSKDGKMSLAVNHLAGIEISNSGGDIEINCKKLTINGDDDTEFAFEKKLSIKVKQKYTLEGKKNVKCVAKKEAVIKGKKIKLTGSTGVTAGTKQIASKNDQVIGLDIHKEFVQAGTATIQVPFPNPFIGKLQDKLSKNVMLGEKNVAVKGSIANNSPKHVCFPPGISFVQPPNNQGEINSGTISNVKVNNKEVAVMLSGAKTCTDMGPPVPAKVVAAGVAITAVLPGYKAYEKKKTQSAKKKIGTKKVPIATSPTKKKCPNPDGKKGCKAHRDKIDAVEKDLQKKYPNHDITREAGFEVVNGKKKKRYADIIVADKNGKVIEIHQVGKTNPKSKTIVSREKDAFADIDKSTEGKGVPKVFHSYNDPSLGPIAYP